MVLTWTLRLLVSGAVGFNQLFSMSEFNPYAPSNQSNTYCQHECAKRRQYEEGVREIGHGNFSPLPEVWVPQLLLLINAWHSSCLASGRRLIAK